MRLRILAVPFLALTFAAGCGKVDQSQVDALKKNPQVQKNLDELNRQSKVCFKGLKSFTKHGRQAYVRCLVPPAKQAQAKRCLDQDLAKNGVPFSKRKAKYEITWLANCIAIEKVTVKK